MSDFLQKIVSNDLLKLLLVVVGVYLFIKYSSNKKEGVDNVSDSTPQIAQGVSAPAMQAPALSAAKSPQQQQIDSVVAGKTQLVAHDLLPKYDDANDFAKQNPVSNLLKEQNFLVSGYHVGVNTVMQSNKIKYHDLRAAPPIAKEVVGPWSQSSYEQPAGSNIRPIFDP